MTRPPWMFGVALLATLGCPADGARDGSEPTLAALERLDPPRRSVARFSVVRTYAGCASRVGPERCKRQADAARPSEWGAAAARLAARVRGRSSGEALHVAALLDLLWLSDDESVIGRSVRLLEAARASGSGQARVLADIAAGHLLRAELTGDARAPLEAAEAALGALEIDPRHPIALFNVALAFEWAGLPREAARAWRTYLEVDSLSGWATEVPARLDGLASLGRTTPVHEQDWLALAARDPQRLRERVWDTVLPEWGAARLAHDSARSSHLYAQVRAAGLAIATAWQDSAFLRLHADLDALPGDEPRRLAMARQFVRHGEARAAYVRGDYDAAGRDWDALHGDAALAAELRPWVEMFRAATLVYRGRAHVGEQLIRAVIREQESGPRPALAARAQWVLGTTLLRGGLAREALQSYEAAQVHFERAGEQVNAASAASLQAEALLVLGDDGAALRASRRALVGFASAGPTVWLHNLLFVLSQSAARAGLHRAARAIASEDVAVAAALPVPIYEVEARISRAGLARLGGQTGDGAADLAIARARLQGVSSPRAREWLRANLLLAESALSLEGDPSATLATLDSALTHIAPSDLFRRLPARVVRARALMALDRVSEAEGEHRAAVAGLGGISAGIHESTQRLLLLGDVERLTTDLAARMLAVGDTVGALLAVERGRSRLGLAAVARSTLARLTTRAGRVILSYAFVGDTLVAWQVSGSAIRAERRPGTRDAVTAAIHEVNGRFAIGAANARTDSLLERLHAWLVEGLLPSAGDSLTVMIVADGEIADAPFAALRDVRSGRRLVEEVELRFAPSVLMASAPSRPGPPGLVTAVAVGAVAGDRYAALAPLRFAVRESQAIASLYEDGEVITNGEATARRVTEALGRSRIVHLAAHAVADPVRPLESFLVLGEADAVASERLTAREVALQRFDGLELVVLAACETQRGAVGGAGTMAGLTWAFLRAGARGVVGSSWRVDDEATLQLMTAMHRRHAAGMPAPAALRAAQLEMLQSSDARWRSPASWAGFRYATATND